MDFSSNFLPPNKSKVSVWDLDGTLADDSHRLHLLPSEGSNEPKDYEEYHSLLHRDPVIENTKFALDLLALETEIIYLTSRPSNHRFSTARWMREKGLPEGHLVMRPEGSRRPSPEFKGIYLDFLIVTCLCSVQFLIDDREDILQEGRSRGIKSIHPKQIENLIIHNLQKP
jgi:hypothetical protein